MNKVAQVSSSSSELPGDESDDKIRGYLEFYSVRVGVHVYVCVNVTCACILELLYIS